MWTNKDGVVTAGHCVNGEGGERYLVVWPSTHSAALAACTPVILGPHNDVVAREGQVVLLGGGETSREVETPREAVHRLTGLEIPADCPAVLVWGASSVIPPDRER
jgi:hypothetical protein